MKSIKSWEIITSIGNKIRDGWNKLADSYNLKITISGLPAISTYSFDTENNLKYKTLIAQEMLKKGFLASTNFYACTEHKQNYIDSYFTALDEVYNLISKCEFNDLKIDDLLDGPVCHSGFKRLN